FKNISDATGTVAFGAASSITGNVTAATLDETAYSQNLTLTITGATTATATDSGGTFGGVGAIDADAARTNTTVRTGQTYTLEAVVADKVSRHGALPTSFKNISDATGTVNFQASGSVSGNVTADTLNYSTYTQDLTLNIWNATITNGGVGGTIVANTV